MTNPTNPMLEKCARALATHYALACGREYPVPPEAVEEGALAVLRAIREPDEGMVSAVGACSYGQPRAAYALEEAGHNPAELLPPVWQAMLDHITGDNG